MTRIMHGYEVEWISEYNPSPEMKAAGDFDPDACVYSFADFEFKFKAMAFARKACKEDPCFGMARVMEFSIVPDEYAPGLYERTYIGEPIEVIKGQQVDRSQQ